MRVAVACLLFVACMVGCSAPATDDGGVTRAADAGLDAPGVDAGLDVADAEAGAVPPADGGGDSARRDDDSGVDATTVDAHDDDGVDADAGRVRSCNSSDVCAAGEYCRAPDGMCGAVGDCEASPDPSGCSRTVMEACGCDGISYANPCLAAAAGTGVVHAGACGAPGECVTDADCPVDAALCVLPDGVCGGTGLCVSVPTSCPATCDPECGCDGASYGNGCLRERGGASLRSSGPCPGDAPPCLVPPGCCLSAADCVPPMGRCVPTGDGAVGVCKDLTAALHCWVDGDCGAGHPCVGVRVCPCGETCSLPDAIGTCG